MTGDVTPLPPDRRVATALLIMRIALGFFLPQRGIEKLLAAPSVIAVVRAFRGVVLTLWSLSRLGLTECALVLLRIFGVALRTTCGASVIVHTASVLTTWQRFIHAYARANHLFFTEGSDLAAFIAFLCYVISTIGASMGAGGSVAEAHICLC